MVATCGRHSRKQCIEGKPIRFGYKMWFLNIPDGYLLNFEVCQGRSPHCNEEHEKKFGKAASPLERMTHEMSSDVKLLLLNFYFDNLFTSLNVLTYLRIAVKMELVQYVETEH
jgi:hypothetical protein